MPDESNVTEFIPPKSETEFAEDLKHRLEAALVPALAIFNEATKAGFVIQWDSIGSPSPGIPARINGLRLAKFF